MKMKLIFCSFLMIIILSPSVMAGLWKMDPIGGAQESDDPKEETLQETDSPESEDVKEMVVPNETVNAEVSKPVAASSCSKSSGHEMTVLKQVIGKLLNQFQPIMIPGENDDKVEFYMKMELSSLDLNKISLFLNENGDIYEVEEVLTSMLGEVSTEDVLAKLPKTFFEKYSRLAPIFLVVFLFLSWKFMQLPFWILVRWSIFLIFVVSVVWNWYFLYQENYTKYTTAITEGPPPECEKDYHPGFFESFTSSVSDMFHVSVDECEKYHLVTSIPPSLRVPPTEAISFCIVNTFLKPLASVGEHLGLFFQKLALQIPLPILLIALVFILIVLLFLIIVFNGYSIGGLFIQLTPPQRPAAPSVTDDPVQTDSKAIHQKLDKVMEILEKYPDLNDDVKELREMFQKNNKLAIENRPQLESITESSGSGDGPGVGTVNLIQPVQEKGED